MPCINEATEVYSGLESAFIGCRELVELVSMVLVLKMRVLPVCLSIWLDSNI